MTTHRTHSLFYRSDMYDYNAWDQVNNDFNAMAYVAHNLRYDLAICSFELLWPEFVIHEDCVFLAWRFSADTYNAWKQQFDQDKKSIEKMINHCHIYDLLPCLVEGSTHNTRAVMEIIRWNWETAARTATQNHKIRASCSFDGDPHEWFITLYQGE